MLVSCVGKFLAGVAKSLSLYLVLLQIIRGKDDASTAFGQDLKPVPYLLFTTHQSIYRQFLNGSTTAEELLRPAQFAIKKIDYHYRLNYMFWIDSISSQARIMQARLNGSDVSVLAVGDLRDPVDLAVDWLNDKVYWADAELGHIEEYDIATGRRKVVASTGEAGETIPVAMALYPYPNYGWLYWSDVTSESIEMVSVTGDDRSNFHRGISCAYALSIDYSNHTLYWIDQCTFEIEALRLDGDSSTHSYPLDSTIFFASGLTIYQGILYWAEASGVFMANPFDSDAESEQVFVARNTRATGVQVVHPSQQPPAEVYEDLVTTVKDDFTFQCSGECVHGNCIPPGLCACDAGWRGGLCDTDKKECAEGNGGCEYSCTELVGGFQCNCPDGFTLTDDLRTCSAIRTTVSIFEAPPATTTSDPYLSHISETTGSALTTTSFPTSFTLAPSSSDYSTPPPTSNRTSSYIYTSVEMYSSGGYVSSHTDTIASSTHYVSSYTSDSTIASSSSTYYVNSDSEIASTSNKLTSSLHSSVDGVGEYITSSSVRVKVRVSSTPPAQSIRTSISMPSAGAERSSTITSNLSPTSSYSRKLSSSSVSEFTETPRGYSSEVKFSASKKPSITSPTPVIIEANRDEGFSLDSSLIIGVGSGVALMIIAVVILILVICLVFALRRRRRNGSWSPQKANKMNDTANIDSKSMKPMSNGISHENGNSSHLSKQVEAELELEYTSPPNITNPDV